MSDSFHVVKQKRPKSSSKHKSFVKNVTSRVSELLPSTITKWFSSPRFSSGNGSANFADSTDSSTEDEATETSVISQPSAKRMRYSSAAENTPYTSIITKCSSTNTESTEPFNTPQSPPDRDLFRREPNFVPTPLQSNNDESTVAGCENEVNSFNLQGPSTTANTSIDRKRKSLFDKTQDFESVFEDVVGRSATTKGIALSQPYFKAGLLCSPFYTGRTSYGGAASSYMNEPNIKHRKNTLIKETSNNEHVISHSARRVMDILENYSSPLREAKRIPPWSQNSNLSLDSTDSNIKNNSYKTRELHVPKMASIIRLKQKSRLMDTTNAARQIIASHSSAAEYFPYPTAIASHTQKVTEKDKLTTKMKSRLTRTNRDRQESCVALEPVNLPTISLNIGQENLPNFSFNITPVPPSTISVGTYLSSAGADTHISNISTPKDGMVNHLNEKAILLDDENENMSEQKSNKQYQFSSPVKVSIDPSTNLSSAFSFGSPERDLYKANNKIGVIVSHTSESHKKKYVASNKSTNLNLCKDTDSVNQKKVTAKKCSCNNSKLQNKGSTCEKKTNNIEKLPVENYTVSKKWECTDCWVQNDNSNNKCVCCGAKKSVEKLVTTKTHSAKWQCNDCWVQNDSSAPKCVCCGCAKTTNSSSNKEKSNNSILIPKETTNEWKCDDCWITNKNTSDKCVACGGTKPGGDSKKVESNTTNNQPITNASLAVNLPLQNIINSQTAMWECSICLVRNENDKTTCVCCEADKTGSKKEPVSKFNFNDNPGALFKFGIDPKETLTNIQDKSITGESSSMQSEANNNVPLPTVSSFKFGIPKNIQGEKNAVLDKHEEPVKQKFTFGINKELLTNTSKEIPKSLFGLPKKLEEIETNTKDVTEKIVDNPTVLAFPVSTSMPSITVANNLFAAPITTQSESKPPTSSCTLSTLNASVANVTNESSINALSSNSLTILPTTSLTNAETKVPISTFTFSPTLKPNVNLFGNIPVSQVSTASSSFPSIQPTAVTSSMSFNNSESVNTAPIALFQKSEPAPVSLPVFGNNNSSTTTDGSQLPTTSTSPMFNFSGRNLGNYTDEIPQREKPKFNFTFGCTNNNNNETSPIFKPTFGTTSENYKFPLPASNILGTPSSLSGNTIGGNGLPTGNESNILPLMVNGLTSGNALLGSDMGVNQCNPRNTLSTSSSLSAAPTTGLFANPMQKANMWPGNNNASNTIPQFEKLNTINYEKPAATFTFGSSTHFNSNTNAPFGTPPQQQQQNVFGISNQNNNISQPILFNNTIPSPAPQMMFGGPLPGSSSTPSMSIFGSPNMASTPSFGATNNSMAAFDAPAAPTPTFNFGSQQPAPGVFGFPQQQQSSQQQNSGVYNFGASGGGTPHVQFNMGSAPNVQPRKLRKAIRRTTLR